MAKQVTAKDVVKQLKKHLGKNGSYYWKKYGLASGTPWCCAAVSASFADAGAKKYFYMPVYRSIIHNSQEGEAASMFT